MKKAVIWIIAHVVVYSLVVDLLQERGASEQEAKFGGHIAGGITGYILSNEL